MVVVALAYILGNLFSQALNRDIEQFKAKLQNEREHSAAELQHELRAQFFEYQTRFSFFHNKTAEVTGTTYELLATATEKIVHAPGRQPGGSGTPPLEVDSIDEARDAYNELVSYYRKHRYILSEGVCCKMDEVLEVIREVLDKSYDVAHDRFDYLTLPDEKQKYWKEAWISVRREVPDLLKDIEEEFRRSFTAEPRKDA